MESTTSKNNRKQPYWALRTLGTAHTPRRY